MKLMAQCTRGGQYPNQLIDKIDESVVRIDRPHSHHRTATIKGRTWLTWGYECIKTSESIWWCQGGDSGYCHSQRGRGCSGQVGQCGDNRHGEVWHSFGFSRESGSQTEGEHSPSLINDFEKPKSLSWLRTNFIGDATCLVWIVQIPEERLSNHSSSASGLDSRIRVPLWPRMDQKSTTKLKWIRLTPPLFCLERWVYREENRSQQYSPPVHCFQAQVPS